MTQITGGEVTYERRVTTGNYEHKNLKVTLSFTLGEGDGASNIPEATRERAIILVEDGLRMKAGAEPSPPRDPLREEGMAIATNGTDFLIKWWSNLPLAKRNDAGFKKFVTSELEPMAKKADATVNNNLKA